MSRAFVKEQDVDAVEGLPERPISEHPNDVTLEGAARIDAELEAARTAYAAAQKSSDRAALASASRVALAAASAAIRSSRSCCSRPA